LTFKKSAALLLILIALFTPEEPAQAQRTKSSLSSGNQRHSEKGLKDNKYFFFFINSTVSNYADDRHVEIFTEALRRDLIARILYMKFSFDDSFAEVKHSQILMIELYRNVLIQEIKETEIILGDSAAEVLQGDEYMPKKYLSLGYRSVKWAGSTMLMADNLPETNYSVRLYEYVKAIKNVKTARRYAIVALLEKRIPPEKRKEINYNNSDQVKELINKYIHDEKDKYLLMHRDNYYMIEPGQSLYEKIMDEPGLENIPEYSAYMKDK
jgi:hypothetical protein